MTTTTRKTHFATIQVEKEVHDIIRKLSIVTKKPAHKVVKSLLAKACIIDAEHDDVFCNWSEEDRSKFLLIHSLID